MGFWSLIGEIALFRAIFGLFRDRSQQMDVTQQHHLSDYGHEYCADNLSGRIDDTHSRPDRYDDLQDELDDYQDDPNDIGYDNDFDVDNDVDDDFDADW